MKFSILFHLLFFSAISCFSQSKKGVSATCKAIINHAEESSLYRNNVDWKVVKKEMNVLAANADSVEDLKPALEYPSNLARKRTIHHDGFLSI